MSQTFARIPAGLLLAGLLSLAAGCPAPTAETPAGAWALFCREVGQEHTEQAARLLAPRCLERLGLAESFLDLENLLLSPRFKELVYWLPAPVEARQGPALAELKIPLRRVLLFFGPRLVEEGDRVRLFLGGEELPVAVERAGGRWFLDLRRAGVWFRPALRRDGGRWYLVLPAARAADSTWQIDLPAGRG